MKKALLILAALSLAACSSSKSAPAGGSTSTTTSTGTSSCSGSKVQLTWNASTGSPSGYKVQQSNDGVTYAEVQAVTSPTATVTCLTPGTLYYFRVLAYNSGGTSGYSNVFTITP